MAQENFTKGLRGNYTGLINRSQNTPLLAFFLQLFLPVFAILAPLIILAVVLIVVLPIAWVTYLNRQPIPPVIEIPWLPTYIWLTFGLIAVVIIVLIILVLALLGGNVGGNKKR